MKALLKNLHQSPRKVRLVANAIRGKAVPEARTMLTFLPQKSSPYILKLLDSAVANARQSGAAPEELVVKTITVNKGMVLKRFMPKARGRAARFAKTMSIIAIELGSAGAPKKASKKVKSEADSDVAKKPARKPRAKKTAVQKAE
jgi:large subunit ribosomal protein L22